MQLSRTAFRVALLHLSVNPILSRASISTGLWHPLAQSPQTPSSRLYSILYPQCAPPHRSIEHIRQAHTMSTTQPETSDPKSESNEAQSPENPSAQPAQEHLYLPPHESSGTDASQQASPRLDLGAEGGSTVKLDHLGPMVVNVDGSLSRIGNWDQMTEIERKNTLRVLGKRNKQRLAAVKAAQGE